MRHFKYLVAILFFIFMVERLNAQDFSISYQQTVDLGEKQITNHKLYIEKNQSLYFDVTDVKSAKITENQEGNLNTFAITQSHKPDNIYIDFTNKTLQQSTYLGNENYVIKESLYPFNWEITNETKEIADYTCTKATTKFRGRNYEVWFTEQIPTNAGPWKIHGLPGLILELYDTDQLIVIQVKKISRDGLGQEQLDVIHKIQQSKTISFKEYDKLFKEYAQELFNKIATKMPEGFSSSMTIDDDCEDCSSLEIYEEWEQ